MKPCRFHSLRPHNPPRTPYQGSSTLKTAHAADWCSFVCHSYNTDCISLWDCQMDLSNLASNRAEALDAHLHQWQQELQLRCQASAQPKQGAGRSPVLLLVRHWLASG